MYRVSLEDLKNCCEDQPGARSHLLKFVEVHSDHAHSAVVLFTCLEFWKHITC